MKSIAITGPICCLYGGKWLPPPDHFLCIQEHEGYNWRTINANSNPSLRCDAIIDCDGSFQKSSDEACVGYAVWHQQHMLIVAGYTKILASSLIPSPIQAESRVLLKLSCMPKGQHSQYPDQNKFSKLHLFCKWNEGHLMC